MGIHRQDERAYPDKIGKELSMTEARIGYRKGMNRKIKDKSQSERVLYELSLPRH